jgi:hypothetical protein
MLQTVYAIVTCVLAVLGIGWILWLMRHGDTDRHDEDRARRFFDEHGHWPDETREQADAERASIAATSGAPAPPVSRPSPDGSV